SFIAICSYPKIDKCLYRKAPPQRSPAIIPKIWPCLGHGIKPEGETSNDQNEQRVIDNNEDDYVNNRPGAGVSGHADSGNRESAADEADNHLRHER
ncbi:hypothetical protein MBAV_001465, partial [Candidatus Magnetobacterium bavaricum]